MIRFSALVPLEEEHFQHLGTLRARLKPEDFRLECNFDVRFSLCLLDLLIQKPEDEHPRLKSSTIRFPEDLKHVIESPYQVRVLWSREDVFATFVERFGAECRKAIGCAFPSVFCWLFGRAEKHRDMHQKADIERFSIIEFCTSNRSPLGRFVFHLGEVFCCRFV